MATLVLATCVSSRAATQSQTQSFSGKPNLTAYLLFNQFDEPAWGTLNSIYITLTLYSWGGALRLDNDSPSTASSSVTFGSRATLTSEDVILRNSSNKSVITNATVATTATLSLGVDDGDIEAGGTPFFSYQGGDYGQIVVQPASLSKAGFIGSAYYDGFVGNASYTITVDANQYLNVGALSGAQQQIDPLSASGTVVITYDYQGNDPPAVVPEPSTLGLWLGGSLLLALNALRLRR